LHNKQVGNNFIQLSKELNTMKGVERKCYSCSYWDPGS